MSMIEEMGYFGNIWVRQNWMRRKGDFVTGHMHYHDHVSLLAKGSVSVQIDDNEPKVFTAPTFILVRKEHKHKITALECDTVWYCVFALRDIDGEVTDIIDEANLPNYYTNYSAAEDNFWRDKEIERGSERPAIIAKTWIDKEHEH